MLPHLNLPRVVVYLETPHLPPLPPPLLNHNNLPLYSDHPLPQHLSLNKRAPAYSEEEQILPLPINLNSQAGSSVAHSLPNRKRKTKPKAPVAYSAAASAVNRHLLEGACLVPRRSHPQQTPALLELACSARLLNNRSPAFLVVASVNRRNPNRTLSHNPSRNLSWA